MSHYSLRRHVSDQICPSSGLKMSLKRFTALRQSLKSLLVKKQCLNILVLCNNIPVKSFNDILRPDDGQIWSETCRLSE
jgi:hypothetical protein